MSNNDTSYIISFTLSRQEYELILEETIAVDIQTLEYLKNNPPAGNIAAIRMPVEDFSFLIDGIAAEARCAGHTPRKKRLSDLADRLSDLLEKFMNDPGRDS